MDDRLISAPTGEHFVQIPPDQAALVEAVGAFADHGLDRREAVILVGARANLEAIEAWIGRRRADLAASKQGRQLLLLDADETLDRFLVKDVPDWGRFQETIGAVIRDALQGPFKRVRIWGEMVDGLWRQDRVTAAIRLEELWNSLGRTHPFCLFCTYSIEPLSASHASQAMVRGILNTHSCVIPNENYNRLECAVETALEEVLGVSQSGMVRTLVRTQADLPRMPQAQALIFWLQEHMPLVAEKIVARGKALYAGAALP